MNKIYDIVNEKSNGKYRDVRFNKAVFSKHSVTVTALCSEKSYGMVKADEQELLRILTDACAFHVPIKLEVVKAKSGADAVRSAVADFLRFFPYMTAGASIAVPSENVLRLSMFGSMYNLAKDDFLPRLEEFLKENFFEDIKVETTVSDYVEKSEREVPAAPIKKEYAVSMLNPVLGYPNDVQTLSAIDKAQSASNVNGNNDDIIVCGALAMATAMVSKGGGVKRSRKYEKFLLFDGEHTLQCRFFPHDENTVTGLSLCGKTVCAYGNTQLERGRTGECSMTARSLALCDIAGFNLPKAPEEPKTYVTVKPEQYSEYVQASLFQRAETLPECLHGVFVAFDFETTGLSILYDKPTELGAVKIVDGVITETFHTMIDPQRPIPEEVSKKTGITDDMVKGQPLFEEVLPDFYKFTYGCSLVGHNIAFDFPFLLKYGNKAGYPFYKSPTFDTLGMAPLAIPGIEVLTLDNVLSELGLVNDNAHRALSDATATAKAFIAMQKIIASRK